jgi:PAS domain S-box-containing protein
MSLIGIIDLVSFCILLIALFSLIVRKRRNGIHRDIVWILGGLIFVTAGYFFFMLLEWLNINHNLESVENILGASLPMLWAFVIYSFIQIKTREDLAISREDLRITLNSIGDAVIATDVYGRITRMNNTAEVITGWNIEHALGRKVEDIITFLDAESKKKITNPVATVLETGKIVKLGNQAILQARNSTFYYVSDSAAPIFNDNQDICGVVLVFSDMTEHFLQEEKIRYSEERLNLAISATQAGLWDWFPAENISVFDERWAAIIGYTLSELQPVGPDTWRKRIHPEDLVRLE